MIKLKSLVKAAYVTFTVCGFMIVITYAIVENERTDKVNIKIENFKKGATLICLGSDKESIHTIAKGNWDVERNQFVDKVNQTKIFAQDCVEVK